MDLSHSIGGVGGMAGTREKSILPLPEEVVAQIKSSTAIISLTCVVLELLKNALDAQATKIEVTVDFARGGCAVEDNGIGIPPVEFTDDGGLAKLYCTSKYYAPEVSLGRNGTFLASLAAMSLLVIASHHHAHRSHNSVTFHHSNVIERQMPASAQHTIQGKHGTRVTVRNLFGNLPVRVKQRAMVAEQRPENDRLWDNLRRGVTSLMLSWRRSVSLKVRDSDGKTINLNNTSWSPLSNARITEVSQPRSNELQYTLSTLTQANYITFEQWSSWVPASASTSNISIKGAISLDPAPTKRVQFISLGFRPLAADAGHNEIYDEVNRAFALSNFGTLEDDADVGEHEKVRRQNDKRYKNEGYTTRQLKSRKGVDRFPMFHLAILLRGGNAFEGSEDSFIDDEMNLQAVVAVLNAMITQWLSVHHFRPHRSLKGGGMHSTLRTKDNSDRDNLATDFTLQSKSGNQSGFSRPDSTAPELRKRKRSVQTSSVIPEHGRNHVFAEWSRIKSGKSEFFADLSTRPKQAAGKENNISPQNPASRSDQQSDHESPIPSTSLFCNEPLPKGSLGIPSQRVQTTVEPNVHLDENENEGDDTMTWKDPSTGQDFLLNARTGCVLPRVPERPHTNPSILRGQTLQDFNKPLRLSSKPSKAEVRDTPWLNNVLKTWENPIFKPAEKRIPRVSLHEHFGGGDCTHSRHFDRVGFDTEKSIEESARASLNNLSKRSLCEAQVIAQVDKKFILAKMLSSKLSANGGRGDEVLILVDQHAADERVRVEELLTKLCTPPPQQNSQGEFLSKLGHKSQVQFTILEKPIQFTISSTERDHFTTYAARFATWGILFDITKSATESNDLSNPQPVLSIVTLPPSVSERCKADPQLLVALLRTTVWQYVEDLHLPPLPSSFEGLEDSHDDDCQSWVKRLATCPPGLIDLINSRACRSAIMFNDELTVEQCEKLIQDLSRCVFPFTCAHGRPSMVPLVGISGVAGADSFGLASILDETDVKKDFVSAWKQWKNVTTHKT